MSIRKGKEKERNDILLPRSKKERQKRNASTGIRRLSIFLKSFFSLIASSPASNEGTGVVSSMFSCSFSSCMTGERREDWGERGN